MFDDMMRRGTSTYSRYLTGFLVSIPLIFIAILILFLSSANDGKKRNITAIGMDTVLGILRASMDEMILPTSEVFIIYFPAEYGR